MRQFRTNWTRVHACTARLMLPIIRMSCRCHKNTYVPLEFFPAGAGPSWRLPLTCNAANAATASPLRRHSCQCCLAVIVSPLLQLLPPDTSTVSTQVMDSPWHQPMPLGNPERQLCHHQPNDRHNQAPGGRVRHQQQVRNKHTSPGHGPYQRRINRFKRYRISKRANVSVARVLNGGCTNAYTLTSTFTLSTNKLDCHHAVCWQC